jgi:hypothetical protein
LVALRSTVARLDSGSEYGLTPEQIEERKEPVAIEDKWRGTPAKRRAPQTVLLGDRRTREQQIQPSKPASLKVVLEEPWFSPLEGKVFSFKDFSEKSLAPSGWQRLLETGGATDSVGLMSYLDPSSTLTQYTDLIVLSKKIMEETWAPQHLPLQTHPHC